VLGWAFVDGGAVASQASPPQVLLIADGCARKAVDVEGMIRMAGGQNDVFDVHQLRRLAQYRSLLGSLGFG
jgi:hypothetical protein